MKLSLSAQLSRIANELGGEEQDILLQAAAALAQQSSHLSFDLLAGWRERSQREGFGNGDIRSTIRACADELEAALAQQVQPLTENFDAWWTEYAATYGGDHGIAYWSLTRVAAEDAWKARDRMAQQAQVDPGFPLTKGGTFPIGKQAQSIFQQAQPRCEHDFERAHDYVVAGGVKRWCDGPVAAPQPVCGYDHSHGRCVKCRWNCAPQPEDVP